MAGLPQSRPVLSETEGARSCKGDGLMSFPRWGTSVFPKAGLRAILSLADPTRSLWAGKCESRGETPKLE
ncbi:hypothetical protein D3P04_20055 [Paracoccus onubensis]|uniref:Uncharacterized protein n=1 Tax=Paracoccus onubensis TaxID=1675788 RepID=A0A418SN95_9RHOB|nr:hypothetical protein D3P04_20055 [Paracoccus onubensis]